MKGKPEVQAELSEMLKEELVQAIKQDDEISPLLPMIQGSGSEFPMCASSIRRGRY